MTQPNAPTEEVTPAEVADEDLDGTAPPEVAEDAKKGVRAKLEAAEVERDTLRGQLDAVHRQVFEGAAEAVGIKPELLTAVGVSLADHLREDGSVDAASLHAAAEAKRIELGIPAKARRPQPNPLAGATAAHDAEDAEGGWAGAFRARTGGIQKT